VVDDTTAAGAPFSDRELILFVTFGFIAVTLIGQGLLLPSVFRWLGLAQHAAHEHQRKHKAELAARSGSIERGAQPAEAIRGRISSEALAILRARHGRHGCRMMCGNVQGWDAVDRMVGSEATPSLRSRVRCGLQSSPSVTRREAPN
jgi:hypothetical protein